ncbi:MAG: polymerase [Edaphobacter sp.]|nr:polymerase [Edaphobacter sp.]
MPHVVAVTVAWLVSRSPVFDLCIWEGHILIHLVCRQIREELKLTASAGGAPNKSVAKIASDWHNRMGLFII